MAIDAATVRKVAKLARLNEPEARLEPLARELNGIMTWIEMLAEVDVDGVEVVTRAGTPSPPQHSPRKEDVDTTSSVGHLGKLGKQAVLEGLSALPV